MYLTKCKVEKKKSLGCRFILVKEMANFEDPQPLQIKLDSNTSIGHPSISNDEKTLIFSSDMKGGYGGKDLWIVKKKSVTNGATCQFILLLILLPMKCSLPSPRRLTLL